MATFHLCTTLTLAGLVCLDMLCPPRVFTAEKELFDSQRDLVVGAETDFAQKESIGLNGYDLGGHNHDIRQYKRGWFDLTCHFRPQEGEKWVHVVDRAGAPVDEGAMAAYCDNTTSASALEMPERYLLLGYTPLAADARDGSGLRKNFAILMSGRIRQDVDGDTQKNGEASFALDGYLFDRRLSRFISVQGKNHEIPRLESFCARLEKSSSAKEKGALRFTDVPKILKESGMGSDEIGGSSLWREVIAHAGEDFLVDMNFICQMQRGSPIEFAASYQRIDAFIKGPVASGETGSYHIASFGRDLMVGALRVSTREGKGLVHPCRYMRFTPDMAGGSGVIPLSTDHSGIVATMAGKVCFDAHIQVERTNHGGLTPDCAAPFNIGCVADHSASLVVDPWAQVSLGLFDKNGMTAVSILEGHPRGEDLLELIKFNMTAAASSVYTKIDTIRRLVVTSIDYDVTLDALRGKLGIHLSDALASVADSLFASMVNMVKIWDKAAQMPTTLSDFKGTYLDQDKSFDLVKFPDRIAWQRTTRLIPAVFYLDGPNNIKTPLKKDGCACFTALSALVDARSSLFNHLECLVGRFAVAAPASYKTQTLALFNGIEETCLNFEGSDECRDKRVYLDKKNKIQQKSGALDLCEERSVPAVSSGISR